jgi:hypothetical protein
MVDLLIYLNTPHVANNETASTARLIRCFEQNSFTHYIRTLQGVESNEKTTSTSLKLTMNGEIHHVMMMALVLVSFERTDSELASLRKNRVLRAFEKSDKIVYLEKTLP